ncbi:ABC transporter permease [Catenovulum sp. SX2]|uniref:ABC transporter permease n=1 Tax=Catenovulum sp. SX2 TaxID=3398614 RepID=UPI003F838591
MFSACKQLCKIHISTLLIALVISVPLISIAIEALAPNSDTFAHIQQTVLADYVINTCLLALGVSVLVICIGVPLAWIIAVCDFRFKSFFQWALVLPLAMPAYIVAYTYTDLFDYAGPIQTSLRSWFGWQSASDYYFFDIRSLPGAIVVLAFVLYPYVYLMVRAGFLEQQANLTHVARTLGYSPLKSFFKVSVPIARNAIIASTASVLMESIADFATVKYFAVSTLTTAVYDTWLGYYDLAAAAKLSVIMVAGIFVLLYFERIQNGKKQTHNDAKLSAHKLSYQLNKKQSIAAIGFCSLILLLSFVVPLVILANYAIDYFAQAWNNELVQFTLNSLLIAGLTAAISIALALVLNFSLRIKPIKLHKSSLKLASSGYAIPGTVMAIGVLIPLAFLDNQINQVAESLNLTTPGLLLSGSFIAIVFAHSARFVAIANKGIEASYGKVSPSLDMVAKTMGQSSYKIFRKVHLPLIRKSVLVAGLLIFVESMKELPAALLLRPFDFQTLPTYVFQYASTEQLEIAALGAIVIVLVGLVPLIMINRSIEQH